MEPSQGSSANPPTWGELLQSYTTQTTLLQVNMNEMIFNLRNMEDALKGRGVSFEARLGQVENLVVSLQAELEKMCRDFVTLTQPPIYVDFMEMEKKDCEPEEDRVLVANKDVSTDAKEEPKEENDCSRSPMATQNVPNSV